MSLFFPACFTYAMNQKKNTVPLVAALVLAVLVIGGIYAYSRRAPSEPQNPVQTSYTLEDLRSASTTARCYAAIGDGVYDFTRYVQDNPGSATICGTDATEAAGRIGGGKAEETFASLRIGSFSR